MIIDAPGAVSFFDCQSGSIFCNEFSRAGLSGRVRFSLSAVILASNEAETVLYLSNLITALIIMIVVSRNAQKRSDKPLLKWLWQN